MIRPGIASALSSVLLVTVAASAQPPTASPDQRQPQERRICRAMERPGSLAGSRRVCMTRAEWERQAEQARRDGEQMMSGMDACGSRAEGGTAIGTEGVGQQTGSAMARMSGC